MAPLNLHAALLALGLHADPDTVRMVADAARRHRLPVVMEVAVCTKESGMGTDPRALSLCGVRLRGRYVRDPWLSADVAGRTLARGRRRCGSWRRALIAFRYHGDCRGRDPDGYARRVLAIARRLREALRR